MRADRSTSWIVLAACAGWGCTGGALRPEAPVDDGGAQDGCAPYVSSADLETPVVSFASDVLPLLSHSCGLAPLCHRFVGPSSSQNWGAPLVYLGCVGADSPEEPCDDLDPGPDVYRALVGFPDGGPDAGPQAPIEVASMPFVTRGDPSKSYLMHKIDGDLCIVQGCIPENPLVLGAEMTPPWCGVQEPYRGPPLDDASRDLVRRWIAQGAKNN